MMTMGAIKSSQAASLLALSSALLLVVMPLSAHGQDVPGTQCNDQVSHSGDNDCFCNDTTLLYDYAKHDCFDAFTFFDSDLCGGNLHRSALEDDCICMNGFTLNTDNTCVNVDECLDASTCSSSEVCFDDGGSYVTATADGSYYCTCNRYQYRDASSPGRCSNAHLEDNRKWNDCPHAARKAGALLECSCFAKYAFVDTDGDGRNCQLAEGYTDCTDGRQNLMCVTDPEGVDTVYVFQGYSDTLDENGEAVDLDECNDLRTDVTCWVNSHCVNLPDGQGYECECDPGYTDALFQESITTKECLRVGENSIITDCNVLKPVRCDGNKIVKKFTTLITDNGPEFKLLTGSVTVSNNINVLLCSVIQSFGSVYGKGFVHATTEDNKTYKIWVLVDTRITNGSRINAMCHPLDMDSDHCMLPYGVPVAVSDASYLDPTDGLNISEPCPDFHKCVENKGSFSCKCIAGPVDGVCMSSTGSGSDHNNPGRAAGLSFTACVIMGVVMRRGIK